MTVCTMHSIKLSNGTLIHNIKIDCKIHILSGVDKWSPILCRVEGKFGHTPETWQNTLLPSLLVSEGGW